MKPDAVHSTNTAGNKEKPQKKRELTDSGGCVGQELCLMPECCYNTQDLLMLKKDSELDRIKLADFLRHSSGTLWPTSTFRFLKNPVSECEASFYLLYFPTAVPSGRFICGWMLVFFVPIFCWLPYSMMRLHFTWLTLSLRFSRMHWLTCAD